MFPVGLESNGEWSVYGRLQLTKGLLDFPRSVEIASFIAQPPSQRHWGKSPHEIPTPFQYCFQENLLPTAYWL